MRLTQKRAFTFILSGIVLWVIIAAVTGNGRFADWAFILILLSGYFFSFAVGRKEIARERSRVQRIPTMPPEIDTKKKESNGVQEDMVLTLSKELHEPLSEIQHSLSLLMSGTYGKLSPGVEEGLRQILQKTNELGERTSFNPSQAEEIETPSKTATNASIRNLKVG